MNKAVFCIAQNTEQAEVIVDQLKNAGFSNNDISVLFPDKSTTKDFAYEKHTKAPEGAAIGGTVGIGTGAVLGWLAGIGSLAIPGVGPFIAAGPIMGALSGAAVGAATGSLAGALIGLGIPEYEAKRYEGKIKGGSALISVHTEDSDARDEAREIFERAHAEDISTTEEADVDHS
jgi:L-aminopeptidase/D-esterase-like protein